MEKTSKKILENLNTTIETKLNDKENLFQKYKLYINNIIISIEKILYKLFTDLNILKNLNSKHTEDTVEEYVKLYLIQYIKNLESGDFNILDTNCIEDIKKLTNKDNKSIILIVENIINLTYPFIDRNILDIEVIVSYISGIQEQLDEIFEINKIDIFKLI